MTHCGKCDEKINQFVFDHYTEKHPDLVDKLIRIYQKLKEESK